MYPHTFTCSIALAIASTIGEPASVMTSTVVDGQRIDVARSLSPLAEKALVKIAMRPGSLPSEVAHALGASLAETVEAINELLAANLVGRPK